MFYCHLMLLLTSKCHHHLPRLQWSYLPKAHAYDKDFLRGLNVTEQDFDSKSMVKSRAYELYSQFCYSFLFPPLFNNNYQGLKIYQEILSNILLLP